MPEVRDYPAIARQYASDVCSGKILACLSIRLQCARFLAELKVQRRKEFPFRFDESEASRICRFIEKLPHSKGPWARKKQTLRLEPWQVWILCCAYGWLYKAGDRKDKRRFRVLFVVVPRKNGKSALSAGIGLYMFCADGEFGAEVYSGATNEKQAGEVFIPAQLMVQRTPSLVRRFGVEVYAKSLVRLDDNSKFETIIGNPGDGQSPSCSVHDEYHEHADDGQVDTMQTGMGAREQPMQVLITTAGDNLAGPCYARIQEERDKLAGTYLGRDAGNIEALEKQLGLPPGPPLTDETFFVEYTIDQDDDWTSEEALRKANPNYGVSVEAEFLRSRIRDAVSTPRKAGVIKTKHLNLWVAAKSAYFDIEAWRRCRSDAMPMLPQQALLWDHLRGRRCIAGLDLASKVDIAALELLFPPLGPRATRDDPFYRIGFSFVPDETVQKVPAYQTWHSGQHLDVTSGEIIDYDNIVEVLEDVRSKFQLEQIAYDPHQATYLVTCLMKDGFPAVEYRQVVLNMSEPMKELDALTRSGAIAHGGCPVMEWQMNNVIGAPDKKDNVYPNKPRVEAKIDNPVALMMALGVAMSGEEEVKPHSPWDNPNFSLNGGGA